MPLLQPARALALLLCLSCLAACDESDAASIRVQLVPEGGATITTSSLERPGPPGESLAGRGVTWGDSVRVVARSGRIESLQGEGVAIGDLRMVRAETGVGDHLVSLVMPLGPEAQWPDLFAPATGAERDRLRAVMDPRGKAKKLGAVMKIEIELPYDCDGARILGASEGLKSKTDENVATLIVDLDAVRAGSGECIWRVSWDDLKH